MSTGASEALAQIERGLLALGRSSSLNLLRGGAAPERVRTALADCGLPSFEELETLYGWHDGSETSSTSSLDDLDLFPGFYLLSLDDAVANYRTFVSDARWANEWFPLFANGGGDFYALETARSNARAIRHFRIDEREHPIEFESLAEMLTTLAEAFEQGVFYVDDHGYLEMDDLKFATLAAQLNPTVPWWND